MSTKIKILPGDAVRQPRKLYRVVCYMRIEDSDYVGPLTLAEAQAEADHAEFMQPENKYVVELINGAK